MRLPPPEALGLPYDRWRTHQEDAIMAAFESPTRYVALALPTGTGKSAVAMGLAALIDGGTATLTSTKGLEDQYSRVFSPTVEGLVDIRGMSNYECLAAQDQFKAQFPRYQWVSCDWGPCKAGESCDRKPKGQPSTCLYYQQVARSVSSETVTTNYAYWVQRRRADLWLEARREKTGQGGGVRAQQLSDRAAVLLDEAHDAPTQLADQLTVTLSSRHVVLPRAHEVGSHAQWRTWASLEAQFWARKAWKATPGSSMRDRVRAADNALLCGQVAELPDDWVIDDRRPDHVEFAPVSAAPYAETYLFCGIGNVVLLSATLTHGTLAGLGVDPAQTTWLSVPSPFPRARRPIYILKNPDYMPPLRVDHRMDEAMETWWLGRIDAIIDDRADRKGILHTVSYRRQQTILGRSRHRHRMIAPKSARELARAVEEFRSAGPGAILVSPSVVTGWDFPYRDCEYQVITKVPFPDTRSPVAKARAERDSQYRTTHAIQQMSQAIGRGMRAKDDQCEVFIVDDHARWVLFKHKALVPAWVLDVCRVVERIPAPPTALAA